MAEQDARRQPARLRGGSLPSDVVGASEFAEDAECRRLRDRGSSRRGGSDSTSARRRASDSPVRRRGAARSSGTGRWCVFEWPRVRRGHEGPSRSTVAANEKLVLGRTAARDSVRALNEHRARRPDQPGSVDRAAARASSCLEGKELPGVAAIPPAVEAARVIVAGNWKMYSGPDPEALAERLAGLSGVDAIVCPPYNLSRTVRRGRADDVRAERPLGRTRARTPARSRRRCCWRSACVARSSATRSAGSTSARRTRMSRAVRRPRSRRASVSSPVSARRRRERDSGDMETVLAHPGRRDPRHVRRARAARARV